jgi:inosine-uridine nucleoside N-ribohydrolase
MKRVTFMFMLLAGVVTLTACVCARNGQKDAAAGAGSQRALSVRIVFDTDIGPDCDDAGTLALLNSLADRGEAKILGMACCTSSEWGAPCLDAINTYYGRKDVPIGTLKKTGFLGGAGDQKYNEYVAKNFPNKLKSGTNAMDAVELYRKILAAQHDGSVTFVATGPLPNLANLLVSGPDAHSPLAGTALVAKKVKQLVVMGGNYPAGDEWNFQQDVSATRKVVEDWPTPIVFSGGEVGSKIGTGARLETETPPSNPVRKAYELYIGAGKNRQSWDQTAMLFAIRGEADYFTLSPDGKIAVEAKGKNTWTATPGGRCRYLIIKMSTDDLSKAIENEMIKPPRRL